MNIEEKAINEAKNIPEEEQLSKSIEYLRESTKIFNDSSKQLDKELADADKCFNAMVDMVKPEDQQKALKTVQQVKTLLAKIKQGGNVDEIVKQIKDLQNGC